ncbi:uncharacterized protein K489DRAFT_315290 [Dissoconium aciculare CBS 342.82]|uniref:Major facilitator superfamily transporter n=1 Tax=Dissoconium aciculare CBS 342.82 TaxID=1314786 RepID=A0A6J3MCD8_9PEZI|nr:uncharacterized protein K489DRAFT_315290 [Dissoconium aciculare CBS 342.82]KAF1825543.1 hypothetical protein K489DRAFT_315290 [Dissoconium aciculare CBS 342.82]
MAQIWGEKTGISTPGEAPSPDLSLRRRRCGLPRMNFSKAVILAVTTVVLIALLVGGSVHHHLKIKTEDNGQPAASNFPWGNFRRTNGFFNGLSTLVPAAQHVADNSKGGRKVPELPAPIINSQDEIMPSMEAEVYNPYPDYTSAEYLAKHEPVHTCYLDEDEKISTPEIYAYPGVPQGMSESLFGSHKALGLRDDVCFDRYGRLGPYGYGYSYNGTELEIHNFTEKAGSEKVLKQSGYLNYSRIDWGVAQKRCYEKNKARFAEVQPNGKQRVKRHAYILRAWSGYEYTEHQKLSIRAMINELSLKSGGEYDVHLLVHIKDEGIPIWADKDIYRRTLEANVPQEFWNISTLWSEQLMRTYYPEPYPGNFDNPANLPVHSVYRSAHFALQWFSQQRPEYDFYWNWEMDLRFTGHYYEFNNRIGEWGRAQPRKGLWERNSRFYIPSHHGDYANFTALVEAEIPVVDAPKDIFEVFRSGASPIWGPVRDFLRDNNTILDAPPENTPPHSYDEDKYTWGVGEDADLLTFDPIFDPTKSTWVFREDVSGWNTSLPVPPRRVSIITVSRLSRGLLNTMHQETAALKHVMFPEMWSPSVAFHYGYKAAYVPHPVYFDRDWPSHYANKIFNPDPTRIADNPFGQKIEHNFLGATFYYHSGFAGALWRRWLGQSENGEGGRVAEQQGTGRMCLRSTLLHPVKHENAPTEV